MGGFASGESAVSIAAIERNKVRVAGPGRDALVFGHGFGTDQRAWRFVAPAFAQDRGVVTFDHFGFGDSDRSGYAGPRHAALEGYALDLLDILDALGLEQVSYVGHSIGGVIGLLASLHQPERFKRLVLLGASPLFVNDPPDYVGGFERSEIEGILEIMERDQIAWSAALAPLAMGDQSPPELVQDFGHGLRALDPLIAREFGRLAFLVDCRDRLSQVQVPTLIVHSTRDSLVPRAVGAYLHRTLAGSTLSEIDASRHCPHLTHPQETVALISQYLEAAGA
jgi:sigma-B regulation protein RsbQ